MSKFADTSFWIDAGDRALNSFAQGLIGSLALDSVGILSVDWVQGIQLAASYALPSVLTSIAARGNRGVAMVPVSTPAAEDFPDLGVHDDAPETEWDPIDFADPEPTGQDAGTTADAGAAPDHADQVPAGRYGNHGQ